MSQSRAQRYQMIEDFMRAGNTRGYQTANTVAANMLYCWGIKIDVFLANRVLARLYRYGNIEPVGHDVPTGQKAYRIHPW